jgi:hypothetical protein
MKGPGQSTSGYALNTLLQLDDSFGVSRLSGVQTPATSSRCYRKEHTWCSREYLKLMLAQHTMTLVSVDTSCYVRERL